MYQLSGVTKTYQTSRVITALEDVSVEIPDGEFVAISGNTGGGKSTLLQMLGGLDRPNSGKVMLDGEDLATMSQRALTKLRATEIGIVFQNFNLVPTLTARENVEAGLVPLRLHASEWRTRAEAALAEVDLEGRADHLPTELSGGQQQRVAIARALVKRPRIILADEPTGNLDEKMRDEIMGLLESYWKQLGFTLVVVTHDSSVATRAQRRITMNSGHVATGPKA